ncbi:transposase family protein [Photobacterium sagamiensis]|uniref:Mu transposase C-terminal domain-containing protein n=1 Tax=Photobacterium sagamiensis TaxID=2910241 RepID=UPI003D0E6ADE
MPSSTFSNLHRKANQAIPENKGVNSDPFAMQEESTFKDLTAFSDEILHEVQFRLAILKQISQQCDSINTKTIEPLRVELQRESQRKIPSSITIYRWWLKFRESGYDPVSLASKSKQRGNRNIKVPKVVSEFMDQAVKHVISARKTNIQSAFRRVRRKVRQYNLAHGTHFKYPNYESIRKRVKKLTPYEKLEGSKGKRVAKREFRRMGKRILTSNVLERVEIDHTWLDLFVVHEEHRIAIGRPYLTQLVDCYSKAVVGFYLGFEPPGYTSVALALKNAIRRKEELLAQYPSVRHDWLCYGIPDLLVTDNGKEFLSKDFDLACGSLLINTHQNKVETPDNKPHVERQYGTSNTSLLDDLPGKAFSSYLQREGYDSIGEAALSLNEITEIYLIWLVDIYHRKPNKRGTNCPNVAWRQGSEEWAPDEFGGSKEELDFRFAKLDRKMLRKEGITVYKELSYSSERLAEYRGQKGDHKVTFKYNPENMGFIWVLDEDKEEYFKVPAIDYEYASIVSYWQHKKNLEIKEKLNNSDYDIDAEIDAEIAIEELVEQSMAQKKTAIRNKRRGARYQENATRAKSSKRKDVTAESQTNSIVESDSDDSGSWDIDYV